MLEKMVMDEWQRRWDVSMKGRWTYEWLPNVRDRMKAEWMVFDFYMTQLISGHGDFEDKLHGFALRENGMCDCGEAGTAHHVLFGCALFAAERLVAVTRMREIGCEWDVYMVREYEGYKVWKDFAWEVMKKKEDRSCALPLRPHRLVR